MNKRELKLERRKAVIEALQRGGKPRAVSQKMQVPLRTIFDWSARYRAGGWPGLQENPRQGRPRKMSGPLLQELFQAITFGNPQQYQMPFCLWTLNIIRQVLRETWGLVLSKSAVSRLLGQWGLNFQRLIYSAYKQNPQELQKSLQLIRSFAQMRREARRSGAEINFMEESAMGGDPHRGAPSAPSASPREVGGSGHRFGLRLICAVRPRGDTRFAVIKGKMNASKFIFFINQLKADAGRPIIVIAANANYLSTDMIRRFAAQKAPNISIANWAANQQSNYRGSPYKLGPDYL